MSAPERRDRAPPPSDEPPADEEFARTYAAGYEEGVRSALRELLQHASRGHTAQELRMLAESRLARLAEEVEVKRKGLLAPPRRPAWNSLLRPPQPTRPWTGPLTGPTPPIPILGPGRTLLVREERPARALEILRANANTFSRVVLVSQRPPDVPEIPPGRRLELVVAAGGGAETATGGRLGPGEIGGRLREPTESPGGALVYVDALEFLVSEYSLDTTLKFVHWLVMQVESTGSALLVSFDRRALDLKEMSILERAFATVF
ncbi:MAG TPA: hypothetical protein VEK13_01630 [Thermoplasmata archaeon]|nr:hypothetical protein [Thermoplasmata archaeon]